MYASDLSKEQNVVHSYLSKILTNILVCSIDFFFITLALPGLGKPRNETKPAVSRSGTSDRQGGVPRFGSPHKGNIPGFGSPDRSPLNQRMGPNQQGMGLRADAPPFMPANDHGFRRPGPQGMDGGHQRREGPGEICL